jgi:tetratricopeptide (TPR) repeat protein
MIDEIRLENLWELANKHITANAYWKAKDILSTILKIEPCYVAARFELAKILQSEGQLESALLHASLAHRLNPNYPALNGFVAECFYLHGLYEEALKSYEEEEKSNPNNNDIKTKIHFCREIVSLVRKENADQEN